MKYLTEDDLRLKYREIPFESFVLGKSERLTPGARMFLMDRKIKLIDENNPEAKAAVAFSKEENSSQVIKDENSLTDWFGLRCDFMKIALDFAKVDIALAQEVCALERCLLAISKGEDLVLPTFLQTIHETQEVDQSLIEERLSSLSVFFQSNTGMILIDLYQAYHRLLCFEKIVSESEKEKLQRLTNAIGKLILHYLGGGS